MNTLIPEEPYWKSSREADIIIHVMTTWYVYILECSNNSLYTGITTDLERRLKQHNGDLPGGAKYTRAHRPVSLVYSASFPDKSSASKEEWRIKQMTRREKEKMKELRN